MPFNTTLKKIASDYPSITFKSGKTFKWSHTNHAITYNASTQHAIEFLLHELAHAILEHNEYSLDIELLKKEQAAWEYVETTLAPRYAVMVDQDIREDALDTYRTWLHKRSLCPECHTSNFQTQTGTYTCVVCGCQWRANMAIECDLRRYKVSTTRS